MAGSQGENRKPSGRAKKLEKKSIGEVDAVDTAFRKVVEAFDSDSRVHVGEGKGFGKGALKVEGKIFAMISSKGEFVVKLPTKRADELVNTGDGSYFDPGHGRLMKQWVVLPPRKTSWIEIAKEAHRFVGEGGTS